MGDPKTPTGDGEDEAEVVPESLNGEPTEEGADEPAADETGEPGESDAEGDEGV